MAEPIRPFRLIMAIYFFFLFWGGGFFSSSFRFLFDFPHKDSHTHTVVGGKKMARSFCLCMTKKVVCEVRPHH